VDLVVYDDDEKRYVPWAVALAAALLVAVLTAVLTFVLARQASGSEGSQSLAGVGSPEPATAPTATPAPSATSAVTSPPTGASPEAGLTSSPACTTALLRADAALERSKALDEALTQHTQIIDELLAQRITADEALDRALPVLTDGATERSGFEQDLTAYSQAREQCPAS